MVPVVRVWTTWLPSVILGLSDRVVDVVGRLRKVAVRGKILPLLLARLFANQVLLAHHLRRI